MKKRAVNVPKYDRKKTFAVLILFRFLTAKNDAPLASTLTLVIMDGYLLVLASKADY